MTTTPSKQAAVSYIRWSRPEQASGDSLRRQTAQSEAYASQHNLRMLPVSYLDAGRSAYRGANLAEGGALAALISAVESKKIPRDAWILVESLDRISRADVLTALDSFRRILKLGCTLVTLQDGQRYTWESVKDNFGQLIVSLSIMARSHEESKMKGARLAASWANKRKLAVESKKPITGRTPAWISLKDGRYSVVKDAAKTVSLIYQWTASGQGKSQVARRLNQQNVPVIGRADSWHPSYVEKLLTTRAVLGEYQPHKLDLSSGQRRRVPEGEAISGMWPAIIPAALFVKVQRGRQERRIPASRRGPRDAPGQVSNLFSGLLRCGCGGSVYFVNKGRDRRTGALAKFLDCAKRLRGEGGCKLAPWQYSKAETLIVTTLRNAIPWARAVPEERSAHQTAIDKLTEEAASADVELASVTAKVEKLVEALATVGVSPALASRLKSLEVEAVRLGEQRRAARERLVGERERLRGAREVVEARKAAFEAWKAGRLGDGESRARLALTLREMLSRITLTGAKERRRISFTWASGEDREFTVSDDLLAVYDGPDLIANLTGQPIEVDEPDYEKRPTITRWPGDKNKDTVKRKKTARPR